LVAKAELGPRWSYSLGQIGIKDLGLTYVTQVFFREPDVSD